MNQHYFVNYTFLDQICFLVLSLALFASLICCSLQHILQMWKHAGSIFNVEKPPCRLKYEKVQSGLEKGNAKASAVFSLSLKLYAIYLVFCPPPRCNSNFSTLGKNRRKKILLLLIPLTSMDLAFLQTFWTQGQKKGPEGQKKRGRSPFLLSSRALESTSKWFLLVQKMNKGLAPQ